MEQTRTRRKKAPVFKEEVKKCSLNANCSLFPMPSPPVSLLLIICPVNHPKSSVTNSSWLVYSICNALTTSEARII